MPALLTLYGIWAFGAKEVADVLTEDIRVGQHQSVRGQLVVCLCKELTGIGNQVVLLQLCLSQLSCGNPILLSFLQGLQKRIFDRAGILVEGCGRFGAKMLENFEAIVADSA